MTVILIFIVEEVSCKKDRLMRKDSCSTVVIDLNVAKTHSVEFYELVSLRNLESFQVIFAFA